MKVLVVDEKGELDAVVGALEADDIEASRPAAEALGEAGAGEVAEIASALIGLEVLLSDGRPDAVLLGSASNLALAAVVVATKATIPVAAVGDVSTGGSELNARLIARLADAALGADAPSVAAWVRDPES
jgi:hypothetical protein